MPASRCVVQGCSNISDVDKGISLHRCSPDKLTCALWKRFVRTHRANFDPDSRFVVCSVHFEESYFERSVHMKGQKRIIRPRSIATIWKSSGNEQVSSTATNRGRRKVRNQLALVYYEFCNDASSCEDAGLFPPITRCCGLFCCLFRLSILSFVNQEINHGKES